MIRLRLLGVAVVGLSLAAGACASSMKAQTQEAARKQVEGVVTSLEEAQISVRPVDGGQAELSFERSAATNLVRERRPYDWAYLDEGMPVRITYLPQDAHGGGKAVEVEVLAGTEATDVQRRAGPPPGWSRPQG